MTSKRFKDFLKEYKEESNDEYSDDSVYPYFIRHDPVRKTSWITVAIEGGGPMTPIELHNFAQKESSAGTPISTAYMTLGRASHIRNLYDKDADLARSSLLKHVKEVYIDGIRHTGNFEDNHPHFDTMAKLRIPGLRDEDS